MDSVTQQDDDEQREERARGRHNWPIRRASLDDDGREELCAATTPEERVAMMDALAREAWQIAGKPFPTYSREDTPIRRTTLADA
jgi:hypothetical protein